MWGTFIACIGIVLAYIILFSIWGRAFLTAIQAEANPWDSVLFGYLVLQFIYQIPYLVFFLSRGTYRTFSMAWVYVVLACTIGLVIRLIRNKIKPGCELKKSEKIGAAGGFLMVFLLAAFIALHLPTYGVDTTAYIREMTNELYNDVVYADSGRIDFHHGMCSMFSFFTVPSLVTGISPYYVSLFSVRILGVMLFSMIVFRTGRIAFARSKSGWMWPALSMAVLVPYMMMLWASMYTAEFFYWRMNEAKAYCQFILLPLGFSVYLQLLSDTDNRKSAWKAQMIVGWASVAVSASAMTAYPFLALIGLFAILALDRFRRARATFGWSFLCVLPNLLYIGAYMMIKTGYLTL